MFLNSLIELFTYLTVYSFKAYNSFALVYSQSYVSINTLDSRIFLSLLKRNSVPNKCHTSPFPAPATMNPLTKHVDVPVLGISHKRNPTVWPSVCGFSH